jgi:uncharacterized membrane protein
MPAKHEENQKNYTMKPNTEALTAYLLLFISGLMILQSEKHDKFVRFHAFQSIYFSLSYLAILGLVNYIPMVGPILNQLITSIFFFTWLVLVYSAYNYKELKIPFIGDLAKERA